MDGELMKILAEIRELRAEVKAMGAVNVQHPTSNIQHPRGTQVSPRSEAEEAHAVGLLSYEDLQERLTIGRMNPRRPCMRRVKEIARKFKRILKPVKLGGCSVGFRETSVERLLAHLEDHE